MDLGIQGQRTDLPYDLIVITAAHTNVDYDMIQKNAAAIFDTRNAMKDIADRENIEVL